MTIFSLLWQADNGSNKINSGSIKFASRIIERANGQQASMDFSKYKANYYFQDNKAYTEDDLLVYNIVAYQLPNKVTEMELYKYFMQAGDVLSVRLFWEKRSGDNAEPPIAIIRFTNPVAAAKVLQRSYHQLEKKRIFVRACDSWEQPEAQQCDVDLTASVAGMTDLSTATARVVSGPNILQLNDDCLEIICRYLSLRDQVHFARVCLRFRYIFQTTCKSNHRVFDLNQLIGMTLWDIREFFEMAGRNMEELLGSVPYNYQDRIDFISDFSPNVKRINLNCNNMEPASLLRLLEKMTAVTVLELHNFSLNDTAVLALRNLYNLRTLVLEQCFELTGKNLCKLYQLRELSLYGCENLQTAHFIEICKSLCSLQALDIRHCKMLSTRAYNEMAKHCRQLEKLKISCEKDVHYEVVTRLYALRHLEVHSFHSVRHELFISLAAHKSHQLEYLELSARNCITHERAIFLSSLRQLKCLICPFNDNLTDDCLFEFGERLENLETLDIRSCRTITNIGLLVLLRRCARLKCVNVEQCELITDEFVFDAVDVMKQRMSKEPVLFKVAGTGIHEFVANDLENVTIGKLLKFTFDEATS